jgi:hypothetical protein
MPDRVPLEDMKRVGVLVLIDTEEQDAANFAVEYVRIALQKADSGTQIATVTNQEGRELSRPLEVNGLWRLDSALREGVVQISYK